jgi:CheY-like chemotaxis protein
LTIRGKTASGKQCKTSPTLQVKPPDLPVLNRHIMLTKILIVEDNLDHIRTISEYLDQYDLLITRYYTDALDIATHERPALIITDWELQSEAGDGIKLIRELKNRADTKHIPIIMATAFTSSDKLEQAFEAGAVDYLRKPFSKKELLARVKSSHMVHTVASQRAASREKVKVLLMGANPQYTEQLKIGEEFDRIQTNLEVIGKQRDNFQVKMKLNVSKSSMLQTLLDEQPNIVHFAGHGSDGMVYLHASNGLPDALPNFHDFINTFAERNPFDCIIINACNSGSIVSKIRRIPAIGINGSIKDNISVQFSEGFYKALAAGYDLQFAYNSGLLMANVHEDQIMMNNY